MLKNILLKSSLLFLIILSSACGALKSDNLAETKLAQDLSGYSKAYFASGCFWCVEAVYESVKGVAEVHSGYSGGETKNPTYRSIGTGTTGHAEAVEVFYDPEVISFGELVKVFFLSGDPTTLNRQGPDSGTQYRSIIFYQTESEKVIIDEFIANLEESKTFNAPIVTEVKPLERFFMAENYHQDYERLNPGNPYVQGVSIPRLKRFQRSAPELLK